MSCGGERREVCRCPIEGDEPLSLAIVDCVSEMDGENAEARPPLHDAIDPEALDDLFRDRKTGEVTFTYMEYEITINGDAVTTTRRLEEQPVSAD